MDNIITAIHGFYEMKNLTFARRIQYGLDILRLKSLRPDQSKRISLFGFVINYDRFDSLSLLIREIFVNRLYNCYLDTRSPVIFDIGSNIGIATFFFKLLYPDSTIYCFEPDPETFSILERNVRDNDLKDVFTINAGLSDFSGESTLFVPSWSCGSSSLYEEKIIIEKGFADQNISGNTVKEKRVDILRCSDFIKEKGIDHIDILKIDAEGAEEKIIKDMIPSLNMVDLIILEYHYSKDFLHKDSLANIVSCLEESEFIVSLKPLWMTGEPQVMATYLIKAFRGNSRYSIKNLCQK